MNRAHPNALPASLEALGSVANHLDRILDVIESVCPLGNFERAEIDTLAHYLNCYRAEAGVELIREGESGDFMLLVIEGSIEVLKRDGRGLPQRLAVVGPGRTLGEMSLIDGAPRFASCVTQAPTQFAMLDRAALDRLTVEAPALGIKLFKELMLLLNRRLRAVSGELMKCRDNQRLRIR